MKKEQDIFNEAIEGAKKVRLTENERAKLFSAVDTFIKKNPILVTSGETMPAKANSRANDLRWYSYIFANGVRATSFVVIVLLILGGSTSVAAKGALPGDLLYPVKVNINEGIKAALSLGTSRSSFEASRASLRLEEIEILASEGKLTAETKAQAELKFDDHIRQVERNIEQFKTKGEPKKVFDASVELETTLKSHESALVDLRSKDDTLYENLGNVVDKVQKTIQTSSMVREEAEESIANSDKNEDIKAVAEKRLAAAKMLVEKAKNNKVSKEAAKETTKKAISVAAKLTDASSAASAATSETPLDQSISLIAQGEEKMKQGLYKEAFQLFKRAHETAEQASFINELENTQKFDEDLNLDVTF